MNPSRPAPSVSISIRTSSRTQGAEASFDRFLTTYKKSDLTKVKTKLLLSDVQKEIEKLGERPGTKTSLVLDLGGGVKMEFVLVKPGQFIMGDKAIEGATPHPVKITKPFYLGKYEITQLQYAKVMGTNPSEVKGADLPVENVNHGDAQKFMGKASGLEIKARGQRYTFRLPTEAEWEYACRAGTKTPYNTGQSEAALEKAGWYSKNAGGKTHPVGKKSPNAWGLHDMHGNVSEFVWDRGGRYPTGPAVDPKGPSEGYNRALRGGSWNTEASQCRSAFRRNENPGRKNPHIGFRCVVTSGKP